MSKNSDNIFLKSELNNIFSTISESEMSLPKMINIIDKKTNTKNEIKLVGGRNNVIAGTTSVHNNNYSATSTDMPRMNNNYSTTSSDMPRMNNNYSATSSDIPLMKGGANYSATSSDMPEMNGYGGLSATSSIIPEMNGYGGLSATSSIIPEMNIQGGLSATSSELPQLAGGAALSATSSNNVASSKNVNKLLSMLTSESSNNAMSNTSTQSLENQLRDILKQDGGSKLYKKSKSQKGGDMKVDDVKNFFVNLKNQGVDVDLKLNNKTMTEFFNLADNTTTEFNESTSVFIGGAKKNSKKAKKSSNKDEPEMDGGVNAGFQAFLDLKKFIAVKLGVPNGKDVAKVAGAVQREVKEKNPEMDSVKVSAEGRVLFEKNMDRFKKMLAK
jgi:hypothetical protein